MSFAGKGESQAESLAEFLAPGIEASDVPELAPLLRAGPLVSSFITLFRGSDAEVLARLLVLREIGRQAGEMPRWSPEALRAHFAYLDSVKLETVLKRLRENALLSIAEDGQYQLSDLGRNAVAALGMLVRFSAEEDLELGFLTAQLAGLQAVGAVSAEALGHLLSKLNELAWHFEEAIASGSEFRIQAARRRLAANLTWLEKGTAVLNTLLADPDVPFELATVAQKIGLAQSRLSRADAAFQRALNKIESQRVTLGAFGISSSDVAIWLRTLAAGDLAALAEGTVSPAPGVAFLAGGHELLDRAELLLSDETQRLEADTRLPPALAAPMAGVAEKEDLRLLEHFTGRLSALEEATDLARAVSGGGFPSASYRLSLLALLADGEAAGPTGGAIAEFMRLPLSVHFGAELATVNQDEIAAISSGSVSPRQRLE
ncbi:MAG: hypothetical protein PHU46_11550 [Rhodocyclaceae bacterium]|nr:hypothetical protein [Rhodocyclaceae bacterium]